MYGTWYIYISDGILKWNEIAQSCLTLCDPMDCSPPGSSLHGILQARILEWVAIPFSRGSSQPRDWTQVSRIAGRHFNLWATREVPGDGILLNHKKEENTAICNNMDRPGGHMLSEISQTEKKKYCMMFICGIYSFKSQFHKNRI